MTVTLVLTVPVLLTHSGPLVFGAAALLSATFGLGFGGSLRHPSTVVPAGKRGETMSSFYAFAYRDGHPDDLGRACLAAAVIGVFDLRAANILPPILRDGAVDVLRRFNGCCSYRRELIGGYAVPGD